MSFFCLAMVMLHSYAAQFFTRAWANIFSSCTAVLSRTWCLSHLNWKYVYWLEYWLGFVRPSKSSSGMDVRSEEQSLKKLFMELTSLNSSLQLESLSLVSFVLCRFEIVCEIDCCSLCNVMFCFHWLVSKLRSEWIPIQMERVY